MLSSIPVPKDISLPLPVDAVLLQALLVLLFLGHILFVLLMVGGSILTVACEIKGLKHPDYDTLAREIARTVTVNKSLAVVLGVGPLLAINVLYTLYFYSANALTGTAWIMIVPLVSAAFLLAYAHKYTWDRLSGVKGLHIAIGAMALAIFLVVPLIFLSNINLMLFPDRWTQVRGWLSTLVIPNVLPRYLHFLLACLAVTGLFLLAFLTRASYPVEKVFDKWDQTALRRGLYSLAFAATLGQFIAGPLLFFTLPAEGMSWLLAFVILIGLSFAIAAMVLLWREIVAGHAAVGRRFMPIVALLTVTILCMGYGRHIYREGAVDGHRRLVQQRTAEFKLAADAAQWRALVGLKEEKLPLGVQVYRQVCSSCHALDRVVVGPPLKEVAGLYAGNPAGIVKWANAPGKKRAGFPAMPAFRIGDQKLTAVAEYMLRLGSGQETLATQPAGATTHPTSQPASAASP